MLHNAAHVTCIHSAAHVTCIHSAAHVTCIHSAAHVTCAALALCVLPWHAVLPGWLACRSVRQAIGIMPSHTLTAVTSPAACRRLGSTGWARQCLWGRERSSRRGGPRAEPSGCSRIVGLQQRLHVVSISDSVHISRARAQQQGGRGQGDRIAWQEGMCREGMELPFLPLLVYP